MTKQHLLDLAERVEGLSGVNREVDRLIALACLGYTEDRHYPTGLVDDRGHVFFGFPNFTASLDAAMQLVPEKWKLRQISFSAPCADDRKWHLNLHGGREGQDTFVGRGFSMVNALTSASLRAKAAMMGDER